MCDTSPPQLPRLETGVLQDGDDWPGVFIRGDVVLMGYGPALKKVLTKYEANRKPENDAFEIVAVEQVKSLLSLLERVSGKPDQVIQRKA